MHILVWLLAILIPIVHADGFDPLIAAFGNQLWLAITVISTDYTKFHPHYKHGLTFLTAAVIVLLLLLLGIGLYCRARRRRNIASGLYIPRAARVMATEVTPLRMPSSLHRATLIRNDTKKSLGKDGSAPSEILKSEKLHRKGLNGINGNTSTSNYSNLMNNTNMPVPTIEFRLTAEEEAMNEQGVAETPAPAGQALAGATTLINQGETIALPGFLKMDYTNDVRVCDKIAEGGGGVVYTAELLNHEMLQKHGRERVIVKTLKQLDSFSKEEFLALFRQEVTAMWALHHHKNVVSLIGFSEEPYTIVLKKYEKSLFDAVLDRKLEIPPAAALYVAFCIADAMTEMHNMGMIHRDLKSANILVDLDPGKPIRVVLSDFGLVRVAKTSEVSGQKLTTAMGISYRYASPEAFERLKSRTVPEADEDKASDVYAFAIIAWELMERKVPWGRLKNDEIQNLVCSNVRLEISAHFRQERNPEDKLWSVIIKLIEACWAQKRHARPKFRDVHDKLKPFKDHFRPEQLRPHHDTMNPRRLHG